MEPVKNQVVKKPKNFGGYVGYISELFDDNVYADEVLEEQTLLSDYL